MGWPFEYNRPEMEYLFFIYYSILSLFWWIFYFPFMAFLFIVGYFSSFIQRIHWRMFGIMTPTLHKFMKLETYVIKEIEQLQHNILDWLLPSSEQKTKEEIMKAINPGKVHDYVPKCDEKLDKSQQTVFKVKYLTVAQGAELRDKTYKVSGVGKARNERFQTGSIEVDALKMGLVGWDNLVNDDGKPISFDAGNINGMLELIPPDVRTELANHIRGESEVDEGEE